MIKYLGILCLVSFLEISDTVSVSDGSLERTKRQLDQPLVAPQLLNFDFPPQTYYQNVLPFPLLIDAYKLRQPQSVARQSFQQTSPPRGQLIRRRRPIPTSGPAPRIPRRRPIHVVEYSCGSTIRRNGTIIRNPDYPRNETGPVKNCCYTVRKRFYGVCWLKLEMKRNTLAKPNRDPGTVGECLTDYMSSTCSRRTRMPDNFCGRNDEQHVYLDVSSDVQCSICFNLGEDGDYERIWDIQVFQISCRSSNAPPVGCLQYFVAENGKFCSFGFEDSLESVHLKNQEYSICIKTANDKCSITYFPSNDVVNNFRISPPEGASRVSANCKGDKLIMALGRASSSTPQQTTFCGQRLAAEDNKTKNSPITTFAQPFVVHWQTNDREKATDQNGWCLEYKQNSCKKVLRVTPREETETTKTEDTNNDTTTISGLREPFVK